MGDLIRRRPLAGQRRSVSGIPFAGVSSQFEKTVKHLHKEYSAENLLSIVITRFIEGVVRRHSSTSVTC